MSIASQEDLKLIQGLIEQGLLDKTALTVLLEEQKQAFERQQAQLKGTQLLLDFEIQEFQALDLASETELFHLEFTESRFRSQDWEQWGSHAVLFSESDGSQQMSWSSRLDEPYGLLLTPAGSFYHHAQGLKADVLGASRQCYYPGVARGKASTGPYDLVVAADQRYCALSNRAEGTLQVLSLPDFELCWQAQLRSPGERTALNLAFVGQQLYVTDGSSSSLYKIDLASGKRDQLKPGLGLLGNLQAAPDGEHLYLLSLKPSQELHYYSPQHQAAEKSFKLKGDLFSLQSNDPTDLLALSPDQRLLLVMTYQNSPSPFTPIITVIETESNKAVRRFALKDGSKPHQLLFAHHNPLQAFAQKSLKEMIVEAGLITQAQLNSALARSEPQQAFITPMLDATPNPNYSPASSSAFSPPVGSHPSQFDTPQEYYPPQPYIVPGMPATEPAPEAAAEPATEQAAPEPSPAPAAEPIELPAEATEVLLGLLIESFELEHGIDLREQDAVRRLLLAEAEQLHSQLETQNQVELELPRLFEGRSLKLTLRRREVLNRLAIQSYLAALGPQTVPYTCPSCQQKLLGKWECQVCGLELDEPLRRFKQAISSAPATAELETGHFLLPDPEGLRLLELNERKQIVWQLDPDQLSCEQPVDLIRLPNQRLLVADLARHQIYELGLKGKIHWSFRTFESAAHQLKSPVRVGYYRPAGGEALHYLVVDQGHHRVLELTREHEIVSSFGVQGEPGDDLSHLNLPSDFQVTPEQTWLVVDSGNARVLEISPEGEVEQVFDRSSYELQRPVAALRLWNGHTLIVDAEAYQILELNPRGVVLSRLPYFKPGMPDEVRLSNPHKLIRLPNQDLVLFNRQKALQLVPAQKKLLWFGKLKELPLASLQAAPQPPEPALAEVPPLQPPLQPPPEPVSSSLSEASPESVKIAEPAPLEPVAPAPRTVSLPKRQGLPSAEDRLQALISKRPTAVNKESFEHSTLYSKPGADLLPIQPFLLDLRHNSILQINRKGKVLWHYGFEMGQTLAKPSFLQVHHSSLVITDSYHHRILEVSLASKEIMHELRSVQGARLERPRAARRLENGNYLVADQHHKRLLELTPQGQIAWEFKHDKRVVSPQYIEALPNGDLLYTDAMLNLVVQINREGKVQWFYGNSGSQNKAAERRLFGPQFATRLANGNTLIADTHHHRVLEVSPQGEVVWEYVGHARNNRVNPTYARRLENGHTLISFFNHSKLIELNPQNECIWSYTLGKDVFLPPVEGDEEALVKHQAERPKAFYNATEKRMLQSSTQFQKQAVELHIELMDNVQMKALRATLIMQVIEAHGMVFKSFPSPEDIMADHFGKYLIITCMLEPGKSASALSEQVANIAEVLKVEARLPKLG